MKLLRTKSQIPIRIKLYLIPRVCQHIPNRVIFGLFSAHTLGIFQTNLLLYLIERPTLELDQLLIDLTTKTTSASILVQVLPKSTLIL